MAVFPSAHNISSSWVAHWFKLTVKGKRQRYLFICFNRCGCWYTLSSVMKSTLSFCRILLFPEGKSYQSCSQRWSLLDQPRAKESSDSPEWQMARGLGVVVGSASFMAWLWSVGCWELWNWRGRVYRSHYLWSAPCRYSMLLSIPQNHYLALFILLWYISGQLSEIIHRTDFPWVYGSLNSLCDHTFKDRPAKAISLYYFTIKAFPDPCFQ